jgi:hypothetical protein
VLLGLLVAAFAPTGGLLVGIDETIERRRGKRIFVGRCDRISLEERDGVYRASERRAEAWNALKRRSSAPRRSSPRRRAYPARRAPRSVAARRSSPSAPPCRDRDGHAAGASVPGGVSIARILIARMVLSVRAQRLD